MPPPGTFASSDPEESVESAALRFTAGSAEESEKLLTVLTDAAISEWRLGDATFWQRVKFRSRMLRARGARS